MIDHDEYEYFLEGPSVPDRRRVLNQALDMHIGITVSEEEFHRIVMADRAPLIVTGNDNNMIRVATRFTQWMPLDRHVKNKQFSFAFLGRPIERKLVFPDQIIEESNKLWFRLDNGACVDAMDAKFWSDEGFRALGMEAAQISRKLLEEII